MFFSAGLLTIDLSAIAANYALLREKMRGKPVAAAVKADAYGLGAPQAALRLAQAGCDFFYVAHFEEALALRPILPSHCRIAVLHGIPAQDYPQIAGQAIIPVINDPEHLMAWRLLAQKHSQKLPVIIHIDTGMNRLGFGPDEVTELLAHPEWLEGLQIEYWMSHLACADEPDHVLNTQQLNLFGQYLIKLPPAPLSFANSSGIFLGPSYHFDQARAGAALYGLNPTPGLPNPMRPVIRLEAPVIQLRTLKPRGTVGYGASWRSNRLGKAAILPVGYADGFFRSLGNRGQVYFGDHAAPIIGRISMDLMAVDVTGVPEPLCRPGATAELLGGKLDADAVAEAAGTIGYEVLTQLGSRYRRVYQDGHESRFESPGAPRTRVS